MDFKSWLKDVNSSLISGFIAHHIINLEDDVGEIDKFISSYAYPFQRFIGTAVKGYGIKVFHGSFFLISFIRYYESQVSDEKKWLNLTIAFMDEAYCTHEAIEMMSDFNSYIDPSVRMVADSCPIMIYYFQPYFQKLGKDFKIGFFSVMELLRRSLDNDPKLSIRHVRH
jgi:hypothetical protein